ncbi:MAG: TlpA disulfide reductase family protein [Cytophagales bacterium]|nr:TlpA family protein disulfide reductase [Bernardetiaceae bacterium]MDW8211587.1 TlpA disulfide reductase family protein [Cytophagales bacterium]
MDSLNNTIDKMMSNYFSKWSAILVAKRVEAVLSACLLLNISFSKAQTIPAGIWRAVLHVQGKQVPFLMEVDSRSEAPTSIVIRNGEERIQAEEITYLRDSLLISMPVFDSEIIAKLEGNMLKGFFRKNLPGNAIYRVSFEATHGKAHRFDENPAPPLGDISGKWETSFMALDGKTSPAIGIFQQNGNYLTGTFLTPTGDYRFLEGQVNGNQLHLSTFNGESILLFEGKISGDSIKGQMWSGIGGYKHWQAKRNPHARLPDPEKLTYLKEGYQRISFRFPNMEGKMVSIDDQRYVGKVVIVQLLGSWCPNCMDETAFLAPYYDAHKEKGLEIIGLAYERSANFEEARPRILKMMKRLGVNYQVLFAGSADKESANRTLPMLNAVLAYPTTIFIDKKGNVRKIHTGFSGPGTGHYYSTYVEEFDRFVKQLLNE